MNYLADLESRAHEAMRTARIAEMVSTMYNLEAQFGERRDDVLRRSRHAFPFLTDKAEEEQDYEAAYKELHAYCNQYNLY